MTTVLADQTSLWMEGDVFHGLKLPDASTWSWSVIHRNTVETYHPCILLVMVSIVFWTSMPVFFF